MYRFILLLIFFLFISGCSSPKTNQESEKVELTVSAAASMQNVLEELTKSFEKEYPTIKISFNFGASGTLSQQISQGAPVDLFLSASMEKFNVLVDEGLIHNELNQHLIGNEIVLIVPKENEKNITSLTDVNTKAEQISIGIPEIVPAGKYAKESLVKLKLWDVLENKIVPAKDVRQVLTYVETGNVDAGIVYQTDAEISNQIQSITIDPSTHSAIIYPIGVIKSSNHISEATLFYQFLSSEEALAIFEKYGFLRLH
ncbi:molybdate ABC transporter substrate-binding protein [Bacillus timonensis]|uniref:molybdate ABC transporter substrate-binding protein n=1 Tax=Bacillus timonensis TaxID=1033734 RepID=UPI0002888C77|nr:molybdate ABC transporter substrate-binding protein [Bacillus timonensis]